MIIKPLPALLPFERGFTLREPIQWAVGAVHRSQFDHQLKAGRAEGTGGGRSKLMRDQQLVSSHIRRDRNLQDPHHASHHLIRSLVNHQRCFPVLGRLLKVDDRQLSPRRLVPLLSQRAEREVARGLYLQGSAEADGKVRLGCLQLRGGQLGFGQRIVPV